MKPKSRLLIEVVVTPGEVRSPQFNADAAGSAEKDSTHRQFPLEMQIKI